MPQNKHRNTSARLASGRSSNRAGENKLLLALTEQKRKGVLAHLEFVDLPVKTVLNEIAEPIKFGYFVTSGLASILSVMLDGKSIEVGLIGKEGFVGFPLVAGLSTSPTRVIMQVAGGGFRMRAGDLGKILADCPPLRAALLRHSQELTMQATQVAACNRVHGIEQRLARWLLMSQDRLGGDIVPLTQDFLAHMLGTRRATVTVAAGILQKAGLITYSRGVVKVKQRSMLEDACCECYDALTQQSQTWVKETKS